MIHCAVKLIYGVRTESIAYLWTVKGDTYRRQVTDNRSGFITFNLTVVGDVGEIEPFDNAPTHGIKNVGDLFGQD